MKKYICSFLAVGSLLAIGIFYGLREGPLPEAESVRAPMKSAEPFQRLEEVAHSHQHSHNVPLQNEAKPQVPLKLSEIPESSLREQLLKLPDNLRQEAVHYLAKRPALLNDLESLRIDHTGKFYYVCLLGAEQAIGAEQAMPPLDESDPQPRVAAAEALGASVPIANPPIRHSRPGSSRTLYLDFNGHVVSGTAWNENDKYGSIESWDCGPYNKDGNAATFSATEQAHIIATWERVAEDYAPFDVDVTTEEPSSFTRRVGHALITPTVDKNGVNCPHNGLGGVAYLDTFDSSQNTFYSPAWCRDYTGGNCAEVISHELGHNMALSHDGTSSREYYGGHSGGSAPSWGPIMGTGYDRNVSQWSKGEYYQSNNDDDDLALLEEKLTYRNDEVGDDNISASSLLILADDSVSQNGMIERTGDRDVYHFTTLDGQIVISAAPYRSTSGTWGGNLDIELKLYNEAGVLLESANPSTLASASIVRTVTAGKYYVHIIPVGAGSPLSGSPSGYTSYGSVGQYFMSGSVSGDGDGDNIPSYWEELYFGSAALYGASDDPDNDGSDNYSEFIAGTYPNDAASVFAVTSSSIPLTPGASYVLNWTTVEGRVYSVGHTHNLKHTPFADFPDAIDLPHTANSYTDTVNHVEGLGFYRIEVKLAP